MTYCRSYIMETLSLSLYLSLSIYSFASPIPFPTKITVSGELGDPIETKFSIQCQRFHLGHNILSK